MVGVLKAVFVGEVENMDLFITIFFLQWGSFLGGFFFEDSIRFLLGGGCLQNCTFELCRRAVLWKFLFPRSTHYKLDTGQKI